MTNWESVGVKRVAFRPGDWNEVERVVLDEVRAVMAWFRVGVVEGVQVVELMYALSNA